VNGGPVVIWRDGFLSDLGVIGTDPDSESFSISSQNFACKVKAS